MRHRLWTMAALLAVTGMGIGIAWAEGDEAEARPEPSERAAHLVERMGLYVAETFDYENTPEDVVRGFITHSIPHGDHHVAYVFLVWGDLDQEIEGISPDYYNNWDGFVDVEEGRATVAREFAFDDGTILIGWGLTQKFNQIKEDFKAAARERRDAAKARARARIHDEDRLQSRLLQIDGHYRDAVTRFCNHIDDLMRRARAFIEHFGHPQEGSGVDELIRDGDPSKVTWEAGVVGATDGLLIKLKLPAGETTGTVQAGQFTHAFTITPMSDEQTVAAVEAVLDEAEAEEEADDQADDE